MGWRDEQRERDAALVEEMRRVRAALEDLTPAVEPYEPAPFPQRDLHRFPGLALSIRLCRDYAAGRTLLQLLRPVPQQHDGRAIRSGPFGLDVACPCGGELRVTNVLSPCPGDCGRWMVGDEGGVWSVMLPTQERAA